MAKMDRLVKTYVVDAAKQALPGWWKFRMGNGLFFAPHSEFYKIRCCALGTWQFGQQLHIWNKGAIRHGAKLHSLAERIFEEDAHLTPDSAVVRLTTADFIGNLADPNCQHQLIAYFREVDWERLHYGRCR